MRTDADAFAGGEDLATENARLRQLCAELQEIVARHALMLREGDHRIKNSLQIVASLMGVQAAREQSASAKAALIAAAARVESIARIHDALQETVGVDVVDLGNVLETMCGALQAMAGDPRSVAVVVNAEAVRAPVSLAQPIVLAVNELVVNALRHAFPTGQAGTVRVNVARFGDELRVTVEDDGQGLPADHVEGKGYGMRLVRMVTAQIGGALSVVNEAGVRFTLTAPAPNLQTTR